MISVGCYIPCRDDEENLSKCLNALLNQSLVPKQIVVVNDGSSKEVNVLSRSYGVKTLDLPPHDESYTGSPLLAIIHNKGLEILDQIGVYDYVLVLGADHILPTNYLLDLVMGMRQDNVVVGSGSIEGEKSRDPRGSGRLIKYDFFKRIGLRYPVNYGWESWVLFKALSMGLNYKVYSDVTSYTLRPVSFRNRGYDMFMLGYNWKYALGRCFLLFFKNPSLSVKTFYSWFSAYFDLDLYLLRHDVSDFVNKHQHKLFWERVKSFDF